MTTSVVLDLERVTPVLGAVVGGTDLAAPLDAARVAAIRRAVMEHGVLFFRDQDLSRSEMLAFMANFGTPCMDPFSSAADGPVAPEATVADIPTLAYSRATAVWHSDSSLAPEPASLIGLRAIELPPVGGDTCWASVEAAYDVLSEPLRVLIDGLHAEHTAFKVMPLMGGSRYSPLHEGMATVHPVVRVHPETGRKAIFVNELWTERIVDVSPTESQHVLALLFEQLKSPLFTLRWRWRENDVALWDNRSLQHYAVNDYDATRVMQKSLLAGDRPFGPG